MTTCMPGGRGGKQTFPSKFGVPYYYDFGILQCILIQLRRFKKKNLLDKLNYESGLLFRLFQNRNNC